MDNSNDIRTWLLAASRALPYYGRAIAALTPVLRPGFLTVAVDSRWRLYWSPEGLTKLIADGNSASSIVQHELEHLLRDHSGRKQFRDHESWNICCDAEINDDVDGLGPNCWRPENLNCAANDIAEVYYDHVSVTAHQKCTCGGGSGVDGEPKDYEAGDETASVKPGEREPLLDAVANDVKHHAMRGEVPSGVVVWADARLAKKPIDWRKLLSAHVRRARAVTAGFWDCTYARANRHQGNSRIVLPGHQIPCSDIDVIVDTSGSMGGDGDVVAGTLDSLRRAGVDRNIRLISCDAVVHARVRLKSWSVVKTLRGGGGTDLRRAFEQVKAPLVVVITDGDTPWPEQCNSKVIVVLCGSSMPPSWVSATIKFTNTPKR